MMDDNFDKVMVSNQALAEKEKKSRLLRIAVLAIALLALLALSSLTASLPSTKPYSEYDNALLAQVNSGDTSWVLCASALVLFMTPGVAFFYGNF